jgi:DNA mismatch repair protein MutS2
LQPPDALEYDQLKELIGRYLGTALGRRRLGSVFPITDREVLERELSLTAEAIARLERRGKPPLGAIADPQPLLSRLRIEGSVLEPAELLELATFLRRALDLRSSLLEDPENFPQLAALGSRIPELESALHRLDETVEPPGIICDHASPELARIRRDIDRQQRSIRQTLERILHDFRGEGVLQDEFITVREGRFVLPVVAGQKRRLEGVVHAASGSGQTLFIEPLETIEQNNELVRLQNEESREIHRILRELTASLRLAAPALEQATDTMAYADLLFAKAQFARDFGCSLPAFSAGGEQRRLVLDAARHPLLENVLRRQNRNVVPLTVELNASNRILLISGPNTGGKTVAMKTVGLLALMAQSAMPVPAARAILPVFDCVLADIGDEQSIEESLSSFSAHVQALTKMLATATADSLVLLDELGRATDPEEGGALGAAVLERFRRKGCFILASTHLTPLKAYGATAEGVVNAAMGFNDITLTPTFELKVGAPGKSAGLEIAARLGLPAELIAEARQRLSRSHIELSNFLQELHARLERVRALEKFLKERVAEVDQRERQLEEQYQRRLRMETHRLEQRWHDLMSRFESEAAKVLAEIRSAAGRKSAEQAQLRVSRLRREATAQAESASHGSPKSPVPKSPLQEGDYVRLRNVRSPARVSRILPGGRLEVEAGWLRMQVEADDIEEVLNSAAVEPRRQPPMQLKASQPWDPPASEINVIGKRAEEAVEEVERFLDRAALANLARVRIVHGYGMGILRRSIAELLAHNPHVERFYAAPQSEGGAGATIAELKESA